MNVELKVDGKAIDLSAFPQEIIANVTVAIVESLHGVGLDWKGIEIRIDK
ncbi:MAG: hypothetical protein JW999_08495 [Methanotrichaceae archaeon]|nr:hypothetical protein [Methanotrichaceae archaeon]